MTDQVEDMEELRESFDLIDKDKNGSICAEELGILIRACGENPSKKEIEDYTKKCHKNKDNKIEFDDFVRLMSEIRGPKSRPKHQGDRLRAAFGFFDKDNSGSIDIKELRRICTSLGETFTEDEMTLMFKAVDINDDGKISINEFTDFILKNNTKQPMGHSKQNHHKKDK